MKKLYNQLPELKKVHKVKVSEYFTYTYLPIKFPGAHELVFEERLNVFGQIIGASCCDFVADFGLDRYIDSYVYVTAKHMYQKDCAFNRPGYHSDSFLTEDISYIWSDSQPTIFNSGPFLLSQNDQISLDEMESQAKIKNEVTYPNGSLLRLNQFVIHKVGAPITGNRAFLKICISKDKYDLVGNSHNYKLDYNWPMRPRSPERNIPQEIK